MSRWRSGQAWAPRALTVGEAALGRSLFGADIDYDRVRIAVRAWGRPAIVFGSRITFPPTTAAPLDFAAETPADRAWFVHELTHVWQFQNWGLQTLGSWALTAFTGGYGPGLSGYRYSLPLGSWERYNLEQQASIVEHAYLLAETGVCPRAPAGATLDAYRACTPFVL
jgi:hypothetical protein